jgi:rhamnogalacturonyl hydrolase YesR
MLDATNYPDPETSGTAFFVFTFAWGVRNGLLSDTEYAASINKGWTDLVKSVGADGRLQRCQYVNWQPEKKLAGGYPTYSSWEGEGAFLLAGEEMHLRATGNASP